MKIEKAHWTVGEKNVSLSMPLTKVDVEKRLVHGFASLDNADSHDDIVTADASSKAFSRFRGNIREMHQPIAVGRMVNFREDEFYDKNTGQMHKGIFVTVRVSKGAQDTWEKVLDGTLSGFSIGGNVLDSETEFNKDANKPIRFIKDYELVELSLVDNPANQLANVFSFEKNTSGQTVVTGMIVETKSENAFYCDSDEIAKTSSEQELDCPNCGDPMKNVGWFEYNTDAERTAKTSEVVQKYLSSINDSQDAPAINEGGVDVAEDTVEKADKPLDGEIETAEQGKAETEVENSVETEAPAVEVEADETEEETEAATVSEVDDADEDLAKMFGDLDAKISDSLLKNKEAVDAALADVNSKMEKFSEELDKKLTDLETKHGELSEKFASIKDELGKMEKSIDQLNSASAVRKSEDLGGDSETVVEKTATSTWGGHFLGANSLTK